MTELRQQLLAIITECSNTINILRGTNIDHLTITGFMTIEQVIKHKNSLLDQAEIVENLFNK